MIDRRTSGREDGEPEHVGDLLDPVLRELRIIGRRVGRDLHRGWIEAAGPDLAGRTRLVSLKAGRLVVEVDSAALLHELQGFRVHELLARLREIMPKPHVKDIRFRLGAFGRTEEPQDGTD